MLTKKQAALLTFIEGYIRRTGGISPSMQEMAAGVGGIHKSGIFRLLTGLQERGFIERRFHQARSIQILRMPIEANVFDDLCRAVSELERKAGTTIAVATLADIARDMLAKHERTILTTTDAVGHA